MAERAPTTVGQAAGQAARHRAARSLTREELIGRAEELLPVLAERAPRTEELRRIPDETVRDLVDAGLIRVANPERYGGYGLDVDTMFEVGWRLAQACGSTGWFYTVTQVHNWQMGTAPEAAQEEYFASPDVIASSAFAPTGDVQTVDGGWRISGRWPFSSGVDHAAWVLLGGADEVRGQFLMLVPRAEVTILDDWFASGLKGTGSKSVVIEDPVFVPAYRALNMSNASQEHWRDHHRRGSYGVPLLSIVSFCLATPVVGIGQGAVAEFTNHTRSRMSLRRQAADAPGSHFRIAESAAESDAAVTILRADLREQVARGARGDAFSDLDRARYRRNHAYVTRLSVAAVNRLFDAAGAHALLDPNPLARMHRDVNAGAHQMALVWDDNAELYGRVRLGVEPSPAFW